LNGTEATGERGLTIKADRSFSYCKENIFDVFIIPGGTQACMTLKQSPEVGILLKKHFKIGKTIAAASTAPAVLDRHDVGKGRRITSIPIHEYKLTDYKHTKRNVEYDGNLITSKCPGVAYEFAFKILSVIRGESYVDEVKQEILYPHSSI